jgi:hypothetical protein
MKTNSMRTFVGLLILLICPFSVLSQTATTNRNVILRRDPSTASVALAHLPQGARLTLVDEAMLGRRMNRSVGSGRSS